MGKSMSNRTHNILLAIIFVLCIANQISWYEFYQTHPVVCTCTMQKPQEEKSLSKAKQSVGQKQ